MIAELHQQQMLPQQRHLHFSCICKSCTFSSAKNVNTSWAVPGAAQQNKKDVPVVGHSPEAEAL